MATRRRAGVTPTELNVHADAVEVVEVGERVRSGRFVQRTPVTVVLQGVREMTVTQQISDLDVVDNIADIDLFRIDAETRIEYDARVSRVVLVHDHDRAALIENAVEGRAGSGIEVKQNDPLAAPDGVSLGVGALKMPGIAAPERLLAPIVKAGAGDRVEWIRSLGALLRGHFKGEAMQAIADLMETYEEPTKG